MKKVKFYHTNLYVDSTSQASGMKLSKFSILTTSKLSVKEMKDNVQPLKDSRLMLGMDTARPLATHNILEKVGEEDESSDLGNTNILDGTDPKIDKLTENKETENIESIQNLETEEDILKRKIETAVK